MEQITFNNQRFGNTIFEIGNHHIALRYLFGMPMQITETTHADRLQGIVEFYSNQGGIHSENTTITNVVQAEAMCQIESHLLDKKLNYSSVWTMHREEGILSRTDTITNISNDTIQILKLQPKFLFSSGNYETYVQNSTWCYENIGGWQALQIGGLNLKCESGRTTQGNTPFLAIKDKRTQKAVAFHIVPKGNWEIHVQTGTAGIGMQGGYIPIVSLGQASGRFSYALQPEESVTFPEVLIQAIPSGKLYMESGNLHKYLMKREPDFSRREQKIVYNPWFDCYDHIDLDRFRERLFIAKELGCEVFEVDAGWYGKGSGWSESVGDWSEKQEGAFRGKMIEFANEVKACQMEFGLWMEPERVGKEAPVRKGHPDWFAYGSCGCYYPKLWMPEAYAYIKGEIIRLIETYGLGWIKFDFNFEIENDETNSELMVYYENWYRMLEEIKGLHPEVFYEGCASGGLRTDINTMTHFDGHFMSDNVNPWDGISNYEQMIMRSLPGKLYQWIVVQKGADIPAYDRTLADIEKTVIVPAAPGAGFADHEKIDLDFLCKLVVHGMFGISGNIATLEPSDLEIIRTYIDFYKKWRRFFRQAEVFIDSEPASIGQRDHWRVLQYYHAKMETNLIYVYRFNDLNPSKMVFPKELQMDKEYEVTIEDQSHRKMGCDIMTLGIEVQLNQRNSGKIILIQAQNNCLAKKGKYDAI